MAADLRIQGPAATARVASPAGRAAGNESFRALVSSRTPLDPREAAAALSRAWQDVLGEPPPPGAVGVLWAQWALETGRGHSMHGFNFGNIKGTGPGGRSTVMMTGEGYGPAARRVRARFRAYDSADEGARDYVRTLAQRFPGALAAARQGNASAFADQLAREHYFTADPAVYRRGVTSLAHEFQHTGPRAGVLRVDAPGAAVMGVIHAFEQAIARHRG